MGNPYLIPNSGYGGQAPTIGGQVSGVSPENQALAQALRSMGQHPQGNALGLGSNLSAAALMTLVDQMPDPLHLKKPQQMNVQPWPAANVTPGYGLPDVSSALPDASY